MIYKLINGNLYHGNLPYVNGFDVEQIPNKPTRYFGTFGIKIITKGDVFDVHSPWNELLYENCKLLSLKKDHVVIMDKHGNMTRKAISDFKKIKRSLETMLA